MSKFKIVNIIDKVFITTAIFLIIYAWVNFYIRDLWATFFLSLIFSFGCVFLLLHFLTKKQEKNFLSKEHQKKVEENFFAFRLMNKNEKLSLLKSIFSLHGNTYIKNGNLIVKTENETSQIISATHIEKLTQNELINCVERLEKNVEVLKIICCDYEPNLNINLIKNLQIEIITKKKLYNEYFLPSNMFPDCSNLLTKNEKKKFKELIKNFFIPSKAKSYFLCGIVLMFSSIILPYHYYYLIMGTILLLFSIICKIQPFFKT